MKREEIDNTQNLDLNTTAKKNEKTVEKFSPYLINATYCVLQANLTHPIGSFNLEREMAILQEKNILGDQAASVTASQANVQTMKDMTKSQTSFTTRQSAVTHATQPINDSDQNAAIYERMIIIVPYKAVQEVKQIQSSFERINLEGLKLDNARYLNTKELSEQERANRMLDYLGGFELMDSEMRIFVIEGLGGNGRSMN